MILPRTDRRSVPLAKPRDVLNYSRAPTLHARRRPASPYVGPTTNPFRGPRCVRNKFGAVRSPPEGERLSPPCAHVQTRGSWRSQRVRAQRRRSPRISYGGNPDDRSTVSRHPRMPAMPSRHDSRPEPAVLVLLALCVPASLAWAPGPVVQCEPCDKRAVAQCEQPLDCEPVKEHGCGCCFTCALARGHACGIYTERCGSGLRCSPRADEARPLQALLEGRGECQLQQRLTEPTEKAAEAEAEISDTSEEPDPSSLWVRPSVGSGPRNPRFFVVNEPHTTAESWKAVEEPPCKQRMDRLMRQMKDNPILNIRRLHLPNCDRRGYFKKRQCKPSKGRKRGLCWCVNKLGMRIPDSEHIGGKRKCQNID